MHKKIVDNELFGFFALLLSGIVFIVISRYVN